MTTSNPYFYKDNQDAGKNQNPQMMNLTNKPDLALNEQPVQGMARRRFVKVVGGVLLGGLTIGLSSGLAACSDNSTASPLATPTSAVASDPTSVATTTTPPMPGMTMTGNPAIPTTTPFPSPTNSKVAALTGTLIVPPLLVPKVQNGVKVFNLTLQKGQSQFMAGTTTATFGFNGSYLGPTIGASQGDTVLINVTNHIGETTTVHWHGLHLPAAMDGGPHQPIEDNSTWSPAFTIKQPAATLWYHPHLMGQTQRQVSMGLVGMFILDDASPIQDSLPHTYGVDDIPLIFQDATFGANGQLITNATNGSGFLGSGSGQTFTLLNGSVSPNFNTAQPRLRLRLLNASSDSFYDFRFGGNETFYQVASDGGFLQVPVALTRLPLGPAERAEILVDLNTGSPLVLQNSGRNGLLGGRGLNNPENATVLTITPTKAAAKAGALPAELASIERLQPASATQTRNMVLAGNDRHPTINNQSMSSMTDMMNMTDVVKVRLGATEIWNIINRSFSLHTFHIHDVQFQVLDRNGTAPPANEAGWKDTVVVNPSETVRIIMRFTDYADPNIPYMYHCHMLTHEDAGMMGQFIVVPE